MVKSVQRGTVTIANGSATGTATITAVALNNALVCMLQSLTTSVAAHTSIEGMAYISTTNATTITATRTGTDAATTVGFEVLEFMPGVLKSIQRGTIVIAGANATATATVTTVNINKSVLSSLGQICNTDATASDQIYQWSALSTTNPTTLTASRSSGGFAGITHAYQLAEWF